MLTFIKFVKSFFVCLFLYRVNKCDDYEIFKQIKIEISIFLQSIRDIEIPLLYERKNCLLAFFSCEFFAVIY